VWIGQSGGNTVAHNHIHDLYYSAISVGWTWDYGLSLAGGNRIEYNHLHDIGKGMMSDMGGIYTLGAQPGTILRNNLIHDIACFEYGGWGIYMDQGSSNILIENNIVYNTRSGSFNQNFGRENIVRNNVFALARDFQMTRNRTEQHLSFSIENNIVYFDQGRLLGNNWSGGVRMNRNLYWDARGGGIRPAGKSWEEWKQSGQDTDSFVADPLFVNPDNYDFTLRPESPAKKLGFKPIDLPGRRPAPAPSAGRCGISQTQSWSALR
jgi:hypothetical protein